MDKQGSFVASQEIPQPIIDMHLHASPADANGPPPVAVCAPLPEMPVLDPSKSWAETFSSWLKNPHARIRFGGPQSDHEVMMQTLEILGRRNIYAGSLRFPLDKPIPIDLISKIVKFRVKKNLERAAAKGKKR